MLSGILLEKIYKVLLVFFLRLAPTAPAFQFFIIHVYISSPIYGMTGRATNFSLARLTFWSQSRGRDWIFY